MNLSQILERNMAGVSAEDRAAELEVERELQRRHEAYEATYHTRQDGQQRGQALQAQRAAGKAEQFAAVFLSHYRTERTRHSPRAAWTRAKGSAMVDQNVKGDSTARRYLAAAGLSVETIDAHL